MWLMFSATSKDTSRVFDSVPGVEETDDDLLTVRRKNGQNVVQLSTFWKWFCARGMNYTNKPRMKLDLELNLEANHKSKNFEIFG